MTKDSRELFDEWYQREYVYRGLQENWRDTTHAIESLATWQAALNSQPRDEWRRIEKWYGYAGHFIGGKSCAYHLSTRIGDYLISTLGHYLPHGEDVMVTIGAGKDAFFETYVFRCAGEDENGDPIIDYSEIDGKRYAKSIDAERGHYEFLSKYRALPQPPRKD